MQASYCVFTSVIRNQPTSHRTLSLNFKPVNRAYNSVAGIRKLRLFIRGKYRERVGFFATHAQSTGSILDTRFDRQRFPSNEERETNWKKYTRT